MAETEKRIVGVQFVASKRGPGVGVVPIFPFPASKAEQTRAEKAAGKVAFLLRRPSSAQLALFRHLVESSPDQSYIVTSPKWVEAILKATQGFKEADIEMLLTFDWGEREITAARLRRDVLAALNEAKRHKQ